MARFTRANAADYGRRGGQRTHQQLERQYAAIVIGNPSAAVRVAQLIRQGHRLINALRVVKLVDQMNRGGR